MTLEELEGLKKGAARREELLANIAAIREAPFGKGTFRHPLIGTPHECVAFGFGLCPELVEAARRGIIGELQRWISDIEDKLRDGGIVFPQPAPTLRPPASWDQVAGEFTFVIASTEPERSERGLGYSGTILVDRVILPGGYREARRPAQIVAWDRTSGAPIGEVIRVWEENGQILGRGRLRPEASAARAAVASGAVADVGVLIDTHEERVTQREGLRPLVAVQVWSVGGVSLISDDPGLGNLDPRDEVPGKAEAA